MKMCKDCRHFFGNKCFFHGKPCRATDQVCKDFRDKPDKSERDTGPRDNRKWLGDLRE